jgi:hypothetical protein
MPRSPRFNPLTIGAGQLPAQDALEKNERIDYIYARGPRLKTLASTVMFTKPYGGFWMSDHYGVLTTLSIDGTGAPGDAPNPTTDTENGGAPGRAKVVKFGDEVFAACDKRVDCFLVADRITVTSARGLAMIYRGDDHMYVKITGPRRVLPASGTTLADKQVTAFVFMQSGEYLVTVTDTEGDLLNIPVTVRLPDAESPIRPAPAAATAAPVAKD